MRVITADDLCVAVEQVLAEHLYPTVQLLGWHDDLEEKVEDWHQVPDLDVLRSASLPTGAISSPGLTDLPTKTSSGTDATWRVVVGIYERGISYDDTSRRLRRWAAAVRATLLAHKSLNQTASGLRWVGEEYAEIPDARSARTIGGCTVAVDVTARNVVDLSPTVPTVTTPRSTVNVRPPASQE